MPKLLHLRVNNGPRLRLDASPTVQRSVLATCLLMSQLIVLLLLKLWGYGRRLGSEGLLWKGYDITGPLPQPSFPHACRSDVANRSAPFVWHRLPL